MHRQTASSVTLLSNLRSDTRDHLAALGITSLHQIATMQPDELRKVRGIKTTAPAIIASAKAWVEARPIWHGELHPDCQSEAAYFDIETVPNEYTGRTEVWSIGWCGLDGQHRVAVVDAANSPAMVTLPDGKQISLVADPEDAWRTFADSVSGSDSPIFHWTGYDAGVMRASAPREVIEQLDSRLRDLCKLFDTTVKLPVKGVSLKPVARYLGFNWHGYDYWFAALSDYRQWLDSGDVHALAAACDYQRDDVEAMVVVREWLIANDPRRDRDTV